MTLTLKPKKIALWLGTIITCLVLANIAGLFSKYYLGHDTVFGLVRLFNLDVESNVPTLFSTLQLLLAAGLLSIIAVARKKKGEHDYLYWLGLATIFFFLSADEAMQIHEQLIEPVRTALNASGLFYFAWVVPYGVLVAVVGLIYIRFILNLPPSIKHLTVTGGALYIGGAIGFEMVGGFYVELHGEDVFYALITMCEESMEMIGILIFVYALASYIDLELKNLSLRIGAS